jgi:hypothetical protein
MSSNTTTTTTYATFSIVLDMGEEKDKKETI